MTESLQFLAFAILAGTVIWGWLALMKRLDDSGWTDADDDYLF